MRTYFTLKPAERQAFEQSVLQFKQAERELQLAFTMIAGARDITEATFLGLREGVVEAEVPDVRVVETDDGN